MRIGQAFVAAALVLAGLAGGAQARDLVVGSLKSGTVNWELSTIRDRGFDSANGFTLKVTELAGNPATQVAFLAGEVDTIVTDWLWVAQQRASGEDVVFIPYSTAVGGLMVRADSPVQTLADLKGARIGIAGGPVDKSWLILRAYAQKEYGMDIARDTEQVFGAPPMIMEAALSGEVGGAINFWHFAAKMQAKGMREVASVSAAAVALGLDPQTPLLGYAVHGDLVRAEPALVEGLRKASRQAKDLLLHDDAAWDALRPQMNAADDAEFAALRAGWRAGVPADGPVDLDSVRKTYALMAELGGAELVGQATTLPEGVFYGQD